MTTRLVPLVCLFLLGATSSTPTEQRMAVAHVGHGIVYWHGHRLQPPYEIVVAFMRTEPDTMLDNIFVNGLPVELRPPGHPGPAASRAQRESFERDSTRLSRANEAEKAAHLRGAETRDQAEAWADVFRRDTAYVDSVIVRPSTRFVYWRGKREPTPVGAPTRGAFIGLHIQPALDIVNALERGDLLLFDRGQMTVPAGRAKAVLAEIEAIKQGVPVKQPLLRSADIVEALRRPRPIADLLREGK